MLKQDATANLVDASEITTNPLHLIEVIRFILTPAETWEDSKTEALIFR